MTSTLSKAATDAAAWAAQRRFAETRFGRIAYVERGSGSVALFLHGFPLNGFQWRGQLDRLASHRRCVAPDFMGLGFSDIPASQSVAPDAQVAMLASFLDSLAIASVDLVANDSGGLIAQLFMTRHPERVRTVLLTNCDAEPDSPPPTIAPLLELARAGRLADDWVAPWVADKALARSPRGLGGLAFTDPAHLTDEAIECYLAPLVSSPQRKAQINAFGVALDPNPLAGIEASLERCSIPTRILWGTGDSIFSEASPDYLDKILPESRGVRRVEGAKLFWPEEFPDVVAEEARQLWGV
jgi:haloalkane dehalogenase